MLNFNDFLQVKLLQDFNLDVDDYDDANLMEMAYGHRLPSNVVTVLPPEVVNVLNIVGKPETQSNVIQWILTEGLRQALVRRKQFCEVISKHYGVDIPQDAIFSPVAHEKIVVGGKKLGDIYPEIEKEWFRQGMEPDEIPTPEYSTEKDELKRLSLQEINHRLITSGKKPLVYGGINGLIEYLEKGEWNKGAEPDMLGTDWSRSHLGLDLTLGKNNPSGLKESPDGRVYHVFGVNDGFVPSQSKRYWATMIAQAHKDSQDKLKEVIRKLKSGEEVEGMEELKDLYKRGLISTKIEKQDLHAALGLYNKKSSSIKVVDGVAKVIDYVEVPDALWPRVKQSIDTACKVAANSGYSPGAKGKSNLLGADGNTQIIISAGSQPIGDIKKIDYNGDLITIITNNGSSQEKYSPDVVAKSVAHMFYNETNKTVKRRLKKKVYVGGKPISDEHIISSTFVPNGARYLVDNQVQVEGENRPWTKDDISVATEIVTTKQPRTSNRVKSELKEVDLENLLEDGWELYNISPEEKQRLFLYGTEEGPQTRVAAIDPKRTHLLLTKPGTHSGIKKLTRKTPDSPWFEHAPQHHTVNLKNLMHQYGDACKITEVPGSNGLIKNVEIQGIMSMMVKAVRGQDGKFRWVLFSKSDQTEEGNPLVSDITMRQNTDMSKLIVAGGGTEEGKKKIEEFINDLMRNPESYGDRATDTGYPKSLVSGVNYAINNLKVSDSRMRREMKESGLGMAYTALFFNMDSRIIYGDLSDDELITQISQEIKQDEDDIELMLGDIRKQIISGKKPDVEDNVYQILMRNGAKWRSKVVASYVTTQLRSEQGGISASGDDSGGSDGEGKLGAADLVAVDSPNASALSGAHARQGTTGNQVSSITKNAGRDRLDTKSGKVVGSDAMPDFKVFGDPEEFTGEPQDLSNIRAATGTDTPKPKKATPKPKKQVAQPSSIAELLAAQRPQPQQQPQPQQPKRPSSIAELLAMRRAANENFISYSQWRRLTETEVVYGYGSKKAKLKSGCGFNVAGRPGSAGTMIGGEVNTVKSDPDGTKGLK